MKKMTGFISKHPIAVISGILLISIFFILQLRNIKTEEDMDKMFPSHHPVSIYTARVNELFGDRPKTIIIALYNREGIFNPRTLGKIRRITGKIKRLDKVMEEDVISLTSVDNIIGTADGIKVEPLVKHTPITSADAARSRTDVFSNELLVGNLVSGDGTASIIKASFEDDKDSTILYNQLKQIMQSEENPEIMFLAGTPITDYFMTHYMEKDMMTLFPLVFLVILFILVLCFRSIRGVVIPVLTVFLSISWTMGAMALFNVPVSMMAMLIPIILLPIGCADSIHILKQYYHEARQTADKHKAVSNTMVGLVRPIVMTSLTTTAGFASLGASSLPWIKYFGLFTALGSFAALCISLTFIPACLSILKLPIPRETRTQHPGVLETGMEKLGRFAFNRRLPITIVTITIITVSVLGIFRITIRHNPIDYLPEDSEITRAVQFINDKFQGVYLLNVVVESREEDGIKDPHLLKTLLKLQEFAENTRVNNKTVVGGTLSIADYIKRINMAVNENDPRFLQIPPARNIISDYILLYSISGNPDSLYRLIDFEYKTANVQLMLKTEDSHTIKKLTRELEGFIARHFAGSSMKVQLAGNAFKTAATMELIVSSQVKGLIIAVLVILVFCMVEFRSFIGGMLCITDVGITILINYGILGIFHIPLTMPIVVMSSMVLAVGVDFTIHFLERYKKNYKTRVNDGNESTRQLEKITGEATTAAGIPIFYTAAALFSGFGVLLLSTFPPIAILGILVAFTMFTGFWGTTLTLSSLLNIIKPGFIRR